MSTINRAGSGPVQPQTAHTGGVESAIAEKLLQQFGAGDAKGLQQRTNDLRNIFEKISPEAAKDLYDDLKKQHGGSELSTLFHGRLARGTRTELLGILKSKFDPAPSSSHASGATPGRGGVNEIALQKQSENKLESQIKHTELHRSVPHSPRHTSQAATSPGGGSHSEIRTDDKSGGEEILLNPSMDFEVAAANKMDKVAQNVTVVGAGLAEAGPSDRNSEIPTADVHVREHEPKQNPVQPRQPHKGVNEIRMSDEGGSQGFSLHAQKDVNEVIDGGETTEISMDETHNVSLNHNLDASSTTKDKSGT